MAFHPVALRAGAPVADGELHAVDRVGDDRQEQHDLDHADQRVAGDRLGVVIERFLTGVQVQVAIQVHGQEQHQEQAGERHQHLLADGCGQQIGATSAWRLSSARNVPHAPQRGASGVAARGARGGRGRRSGDAGKIVAVCLLADVLDWLPENEHAVRRRPETGPSCGSIRPGCGRRHGACFGRHHCGWPLPCSCWRWRGAGCLMSRPRNNRQARRSRVAPRSRRGRRWTGRRRTSRAPPFGSPDGVPGTGDSVGKRGGESDGVLRFTVSLSGAGGAAVTVAYETEEGTARVGTDYVAARGRLTFAARVDRRAADRGAGSWTTR